MDWFENRCIKKDNIKCYLVKETNKIAKCLTNKD